MSKTTQRYFARFQNINSPTLLYNNKVIDQKADYILQNPIKDGFVAEPFDWYTATPIRTVC